MNDRDVPPGTVPQPVPEIEADIRAQQVAMVYGNARLPVVANAVNASLLAYINYTLGIPAQVAFSWAAALVAIAAGRFILIMAYRRAAPGRETSELWLRRFFLGTTLAAVVWGVGAFLFMWRAPEEIYLFTGLVIAGTVAGGIASLGPVINVYQTFALLMLVPMASAVLVNAATPLDWAFGAMTVFFMVIVLRGAYTLHRTIAASIRLRLEQQALLGTVERARDQAQEMVGDLQEKEAALAESEERYRLILQHSPTGILHYDNDLIITYCNERFAEIVDAPQERLVGMDMRTLRDQRVLSALQTALDGTTATYEGEYFATLSGKRIWISMSCSPLLGPRQKREGGIAIIEDITERWRDEQQLEYLAKTDALTDLQNRRSFMEVAEAELSRTIRHSGQLAVMMLDIDHFKSINDTHGHRVGDTVLRAFGKLCQQTLRPYDTMGRVGGEEFAIVLPQTSRDQALVVGERIRQLVERTRLSQEHGLPLHFTVSIGVAGLANPATNIDTLLSQADSALYEAKRAGRNQVAIYCEAA
jgi:diguanylate cyclase (GGDEF)-like protein/PAS domain S-box-containing protein